ncbi:MAG: hypothetical protein PUP91_05620 [Rhizonema sp. PD37]|nr:hypothetical protein [Rhizonema sp. PD37]
MSTRSRKKRHKPYFDLGDPAHRSYQSHHATQIAVVAIIESKRANFVIPHDARFKTVQKQYSCL